MKTIMFLLLSSLFVKPAFSETVFLTFFQDDGSITIVPTFEGGLHATGPTTGGSIYYDTSTGQGTFELTATTDWLGMVQVFDTSITTNANGSLHLDGLVRFGEPDATGYQVSGDVVVGYYYDWESDYTVFTFSPITLPGMDQAGLFMPGGPLGGHLLDFEISSTFLAFEDNPFPSYSPVPLPAAFWLLISGVSMLMFVGRRGRTE